MEEPNWKPAVKLGDVAPRLSPQWDKTSMGLSTPR